MARPDLILVHPPTVYDFREKAIFYGPVSDLIPSTPIFEMYPMGFSTIATYLHHEGYGVRIVNLASMMLNDRGFDVEEFICKLKADVFGVDLHWLPHVHGALEVARLLKENHPSSKVLMGGYSSSYFHKELIQYPQVDFVIRGDSTEKPVAELMHALSSGKDLHGVPNLTWKDERGVNINPLSFVPDDLDYLKIDYGWLIKAVMKYRDLEGFKPWKDWDRYPLTAVIPSRGCQKNCAVCGGSCSAMKNFLGRSKPALRSPEKVAEDIFDIQCYMKGPTFLVGDIRIPGNSWKSGFLQACRERGIENHMILELLGPADQDFFDQVDSAFPEYSIQMSPDSHDESVRRKLGRNFSTPAMESTIQKALSKNNCNRFDLFFMIGLPEQDRESAMGSVEYTHRLYEMVDDDNRLSVYTSPLAPFLDPGSRAFENPEEFGYRLFARTLEEHRTRLTNPSWKYALSYETKWMTRDDIAEVSYQAGERLTEIMFDHHQIDREEYEGRMERTRAAVDLMDELDEVMKLENSELRAQRLKELRERGYELMDSTICQKRDLEWDSPSVIKNIPRVLLGLIRSRRSKD